MADFIQKLDLKPSSFKNAGTAANNAITVNTDAGSDVALAIQQAVNAAAVTPAAVLAQVQAMSPAQIAAMCAKLDCAPTAAALTQSLLLLAGSGVVGNVLQIDANGNPVFNAVIAEHVAGVDPHTQYLKNSAALPLAGVQQIPNNLVFPNNKSPRYGANQTNNAEGIVPQFPGHSSNPDTLPWVNDTFYIYSDPTNPITPALTFPGLVLPPNYSFHVSQKVNPAIGTFRTQIFYAISDYGRAGELYTYRRNQDVNGVWSALQRMGGTDILASGPGFRAIRHSDGTIVQSGVLMAIPPGSSTFALPVTFTSERISFSANYWNSNQNIAVNGNLLNLSTGGIINGATFTFIEVSYIAIGI